MVTPMSGTVKNLNASVERHSVSGKKCGVVVSTATPLNIFRRIPPPLNDVYLFTVEFRFIKT